MVELAKDATCFYDQANIDVSDEWKLVIEREIAKATHFVSFLSVRYWSSAACQFELARALAEKQKRSDKSPRMLFVLAEPLLINDLEVSEEKIIHEASRIASKIEDKAFAAEVTTRIADYNFLGPFDATGRLEALDSKKFDKQLSRMIEKIRFFMRRST